MCQCKEDMQYELDTLQAHCSKLSEALRDIYNDVGEDATVNRIFNEVYEIVKEYA